MPQFHPTNLEIQRGLTTQFPPASRRQWHGRMLLPCCAAGGGGGGACVQEPPLGVHHLRHLPAPSASTTAHPARRSVASERAREPSFSSGRQRRAGDHPASPADAVTAQAAGSRPKEAPSGTAAPPLPAPVPPRADDMAAPAGGRRDLEASFRARQYAGPHVAVAAAQPLAEASPAALPSVEAPAAATAAAERIQPDVDRVVIHFDADCFYAQVEEVRAPFLHDWAVRCTHAPARPRAARFTLPRPSLLPTGAGPRPLAARPAPGRHPEVPHRDVQLRRPRARCDQAHGHRRGAAALPPTGAGQVRGRATRGAPAHAWLLATSAPACLVRMCACPPHTAAPPRCGCVSCCCLQRRGPDPLPRSQQGDPGGTAEMGHRGEAGPG